MANDTQNRNAMSTKTSSPFSIPSIFGTADGSENTDETACRSCHGSGKCSDCKCRGTLECECIHGSSIDHECDECEGTGECGCEPQRNADGNVLLAYAVERCDRPHSARVMYPSRPDAEIAVKALREMPDALLDALWSRPSPTTQHVA